MARPSTCTPEVVEALCEELRKGTPLVTVCAQPGMPCDDTVRNWRHADKEVDRVIARAREIGEEALLAQCLTIADTPAEGVTERFEPRKIEHPDDPDGEPVMELQLVERKVGDMLEHRKLQIHTRMQLLARYNPAKYGTKRVEHSGHVSYEELVKSSQRKPGEPAPE